MQKIGFIGLGIMGRPMARNLLKSGYPLTVYNRSRPAMDALAAEGAHLGKSSADTASKSDIVITMLPDSPDVLEVLTGKDGILEGAKPGAIVMDMSSIAPPAAQEAGRRCREKGVRFIDAPVSGGEQGAKDATLSIMAGGESADIEECRPVLLCMGKSVVHTGGIGSGSMTKLANQIIVALNIAAVGEAMVMGAKMGLDAEVMYHAIRGGMAGSAVLDMKLPKALTRDFAPGFTLDLHIKDLKNALQTASEIGAPLPLTSLAMEFMQELSANGKGMLDHGALISYYEERAGIKIGGQP
ncbi:MAG: 2-hydroxy-3-oxopropionate reductase [Bacillota bacterium]